MTINAELSAKFIASLSSHVVFKNLYLDLNLQDSQLVTTNNSNIFVSRGNLIRYCDISNDSNKYHIIDQVGDQFEIKSIVVNLSGNYVAIAGTSHLGFAIIPSEFKLVITSNHYVFVNKFDTIKKILWHPATSRDDGLIVLTNNQIHYYNVSISTSEPQLTVNLEEQEIFQRKTASSISFGSSSLLSGSLTLYVTATDGTIFALYPFLEPHSKIKTTKIQVQNHFNEAIDIVKMIDLKSSSTELKTAAIKHYEHAQSLKDEADRFEVPSISIETGLPIINPELQLISVQDEQLLLDIVDILFISSNEEVTVLGALLRDDANTGYIKYYIQERPLIMKCDFGNPKAIETKPSKHERRASYVKPSKGFGFLVEDEEVESLDKNSGFNVLKLAGIDKIFKLSETSSLSALNSIGSKLSVVSGKQILLSELESWTEELLLSKRSDVELIEYRTFDSPAENPVVTVVSDTAFCSGDYLLSLDPNKWDLSIFKLAENQEGEQETPEETVEKAPYLSQLSKIPFQELEAQIKQVKKLTLDNLDQNKSLLQEHKRRPDNHSHLRDVKSSLENTLLVIQQITQGILDFQQRIDLQYSDFQRQIAILSSIEKSVDKREFNERQQEVITRITERQVKISERQASLLNRLSEALRKVKINLSSALSPEEKRWFREINSLASMVNEGETSSKDGLVSKIEELKKQLTLIHTANSSTENIDVAQLGKNFAQLKVWLHDDFFWLHEESKAIKAVATKVDELSKAM